MNLDPAIHVRVIAYGLCKKTGALRQIIAGVCQKNDLAAIQAAVHSTADELITPRLLACQPLGTEALAPAPGQLTPIAQLPTREVVLYAGPCDGQTIPAPLPLPKTIRTPHAGAWINYHRTPEIDLKARPIYHLTPAPH